MSSRIFQNVIVQMKDAVDRTAPPTLEYSKKQPEAIEAKKQDA